MSGSRSASGGVTSVPVMGLYFMKSLKKTAKDYVQDGLVAMWDGIENAGWGVHDPSATTWKDLSGNGHDLINDGAVVGDKCFTTSASGRLYGDYEITNVVSLECVCREYSTSIYSMCVWISGAQRSIARQNRLMLASVRNGYCEKGFTCGVDEISALSFVNVGTGELIGAKNGVFSTLQTGNTDWGGVLYVSVGARKRNASTIDCYSMGDYYCIRLYSRALTAAEVAHNYEIDKVRFNLP